MCSDELPDWSTHRYILLYRSDSKQKIEILSTFLQYIYDENGLLHHGTAGYCRYVCRLQCVIYQYVQVNK